MSAKDAKSPISQVYYALKDAAVYSGFSVCTLRDLIYSGDLPAYRLSGKSGAELRVKLADLDALLEPVIPPAIYAARVGGQPSPFRRTRDGR